MTKRGRQEGRQQEDTHRGTMRTKHNEGQEESVTEIERKLESDRQMKTDRERGRMIARGKERKREIQKEMERTEQLGERKN